MMQPKKKLEQNLKGTMNTDLKLVVFKQSTMKEKLND